MKLGPALVITPDLDAALAFYGEVLGLTLLGRSDRHLAFDLPPTGLHVFRGEGEPGQGRHGADAASILTFEVANLEDAMARLRAKGVVFLHEEPATNADLALRYAAFQAPGGLTHELLERLPS